jgi:hypothetical protein
MRHYPPVVPGQKFGKFTATGEKAVLGSRTKYKVVCECGSTTFHRADVLYRGAIKSCGCMRYNGLKLGASSKARLMRTTPPKNLVGMRFGIITVIGLNDDRWDKKRNIYWNCKCDCGKELMKRQDTLKAAKSCGCLVQVANIKRTLPNGISVKNNLYKKLLHSASKRGLVVTISIDEFTKLAEQKCHWCGNDPSISKLRKDGSSSWASNGIDRLDNSIGYTIDNCVPSCFPCNRAKRDMSLKEWDEYLDRLVNHQRKRFPVPIL